MRIPIDRLKFKESVRLAKVPVEIGSRLHKPIDVLKDGTVIDGERRVLGAQKLGWKIIHARVWDDEQQYNAFKDVELEALLRDLEIGQSQ